MYVLCVAGMHVYMFCVWQVCMCVCFLYGRYVSIYFVYRRYAYVYVFVLQARVHIFYVWHVCMYVLHVGVVHVCMFYCERHVCLFPVEQVYVCVCFGIITIFFTKA